MRGTLASIAVLILAAGCVNSTDAPLVAEQSTADIEEIPSRTTYLRDPVLAGTPIADAVRAAILGGPTLRAGRAGEAAAAARVEEARSALRPSINLGVTAGLGTAVSSDVSPTTRLSQRIFDGSATQTRILAAETRADAAASDTALRVTDRTLQALAAWEELHTARVLQGIARSSVARNDELSSRIERLLAAGAGRTADSLRATARQADARATLASAEGRVAEAEARAREIFGMLPTPGPLPRAPEPAFSGRASEALRALSSELEAARADLASRTAERSPTVFLDLIGGLDSDNDPSVGAAIRFDYALGTGGQREAAVRAAEAEVSRLEAELALLDSDIERALASAAARDASLARERAAAREAETAAAQALEDAERGFESGRVDSLDLLDLGRDLDRAAARHAEIAAAHRFAGFERLALAGELLDVLGMDPGSVGP